MPFDGVFTLFECLQALSDELLDASRHPQPRPDERVGLVDRVRGAELRGVDSHFAIVCDNPTPDQQRRQTEVLLRIEENLRRLRELVETRALAAAMFVDPL